MDSTGLTALIFGASGIAGWAIPHQALNYPTPQTFKRVIALTNRPITKATAYFPDDPRLQVVSGVDLTQGTAAVVSKLGQIEGIEGVTHVYFAAYVDHSAPYSVRRESNVAILSYAVQAVTSLSSNLKFWTFYGGGKAYGLEFAAELGSSAPKTPFKESTPRLPKPWGDKIFYYPQHDKLKELQAAGGRSWGFAEIRPDAVIGFVPNGNPMNIAQNLGLWLSLVRDLEGEGAEVVFPGTERAWKALHTDTTQDIVARFAIYVSLQEKERVGGEVFNIGDPVSSWEMLWPGIAAYFGLRGVGPTGKEGALSGKEWVLSHKEKWENWEDKYGLKKKVVEQTDWDFIPFLLTVESDRNYDTTKATELGFAEHDSQDTIRGFAKAFDRMKMAKLIQKSSLTNQLLP